MNSDIRTENTQQRLAIYSAIAGVLTAGAAHAAPTASPLDFPLNVEDTDGGYASQSIDIDIDDNGQIDFTISVDFRSGNSSCNYGSGPISFAGSYGGSVSVDPSNYYAGMISSGESISSAGIWSEYYTGLTGCYYDTGNWPAPSRGFLGVRFTRGNDTHYGYLELETYEGSLGVNIIEACFESDPDTAIEAGSCPEERTTSVPVPVGGAIPLTLGLLAIGAAALRRRRRQH